MTVRNHIFARNIAGFTVIGLLSLFSLSAYSEDSGGTLFQACP